MNMRVMMVLCLLCGVACRGQIQLGQQPIGQELHCLENGAIRIVVNGNEGGRLVRLERVGQSRNLIAAPPLSDAAGGSGFFCDRIRPVQGSVARAYESHPYDVLDKHINAKEARLKLEGKHGPLTIEKEYVLVAGKSQLVVHYAVSNPGKADFTGSFWGCGAVPVGDDGEVTIRFPEGMYKADMTEALQGTGVRYESMAPKGGNYFVSAPKRDYMASCAGKDVLVLTAPYEYLNEFYSFQPTQSAQSAKIPTMEFFTDNFLLKPLAQGKAEAIRHPEMTDPLADYVYRFTVRLEVCDRASFRFDAFRPRPLAKKSSRFQPKLTEAKAYTDYLNPAMPWLPKLPRRLKLLTVCNALNSDEMLQLARRVDVEQTIVEVSHPHVAISGGSWNFNSWTSPEPEAALRHALKENYDVILLSQTFESSLPKDLAAGIHQKVEQGASLIYVGTVNQFPSLVGAGKALSLPAELSHDKVVEALPVKPVLTAERLGRGMVFFLRQPMQYKGLYWTQATSILPMNLGERLPGSIPEHEYYFAWHGKLLRYAAHLPQLLDVKDSCWTDWQWQGKVTATQKSKVTVRLYKNGRQVLQRSVELKAGDNALSMDLPEQCFDQNGLAFCSVLVASSEDSDCETVIRNIQHDEGIENLRTASYCHEPGNAVKGSLDIRGEGVLTLSLRDSAGRLLCRQEKQVSAGHQAFSLIPQAELKVPLSVLTAVFRTQAGVVRKQLETTVLYRLPSPDRRLNFIIWSHSKDTAFSNDLTDMVSQLGFTTATGLNTSILSAPMLKRVVEGYLRQGMRFAPMTMHRISLWKITSPVRKPCLRDPNYKQKIHEDVTETVKMASPYCAELYYSGDENSLGHYGAPHDMCHSEHCLKAFRKAMQQKYRTLEALNRTWKTNFKTWVQVDAPTFAEARKTGNFNAWYEHRLFMMGAVSGALKQVKAELEAAAPGARLAVSGQLITDVNGGFNWLDALPALDNPTAYIRVTDGLPDLLRSFGHRGMSSGAWVGYGAAQNALSWNYWTQIFNGMFSPSFWCYTYFVRRGDRRLSEDGLFMKQLIHDIRTSGAEQMFAQSEAVKSPVKVMYSLPSLVMSQVTGLTSKLNSSNYTSNFSGWCGLVRDLGFLPPQIVSHGNLSKVHVPDTSLLILPMVQVLSDRELADIRRFVKEGGVVWADAMAGRFDEFGRERPEGSLQDLFGCVFSKPLGGDLSGVPQIGGRELSVPLVGGKVRLTTGKSLGAIAKVTCPVEFGGIHLAGGKSRHDPVAVVQKLGSGHGIYGNFLLYSYPDTRLQWNHSKPLVSSLKEVLKQVGLSIDGLHEVVPGTTVSEYRHGKNRYLGLSMVAESQGKQSALLRFGETGHLYDTRKHCYLGKVDQWKVSLGAGDASTLALLPQRLGGLDWQVVRKGHGFVVKALVSPRSVETILRLQVWSNGKALKHHESIGHVQGAQDFLVDPGLDPEKGTWTFKVTDLFSGKTTQKNVIIP